MLIWITGLSGSGKSTIARAVYTKIKEKYINTILLDGDALRSALGNNYGYSYEERLKGAYQVSGICRMLNNENLNVVCATMSLFEEIQTMNRSRVQDYIEVYLDVSMDELLERDQKSLYSKALNGEMKDVVGIDLKFDRPVSADLSLDNNNLDKLQENIQKILELAFSRIEGKNIG